MAAINEGIDVRLPGRGANPVIRGEQQVEVNTGGQPQIQPTQRPAVDVEDVTPVQYQQSQYVGQGFTGKNLDERQRVGEQVQRDAQTAAQPATPPARQPQRPQQPQQSASQMSGMAEAQQVQQAQQPAPQEAQEAPSEPELTVPNPSELPTASKRERTSSLDLAMEAGDRLANMGVARAQARERVAQAEEKKAEPSEQDVRSARPVNMRSLEDKALQSMASDDEEPSAKEPFWAKPIERVIRFSENFDIRPKALIDSYKKRAARAFKSEGVGNRIYGKMMGLGTLDFREVGVGLQEILAVRDQNADTLERLIGPELLEDKPPIATMSAKQLVNLINNNEIYVATYKPPNNQGQDMQRRKLKVLTQQQRGIYLHNIMAAMYTADYDGDDMEVSLDPVSAKYTKDPMDYLVDMFGEISLNEDFLPVTPIKDVKDSDGNVIMEARDYVKEIILGNFIGMVRDERSLTPLVDAIMALGKTALNGEKQGPAWGKVFTEARKLADRIDWRNSNKLMSNICRAVFDSMQRNKYYSTMNIVGPDVLNLTMDEIPKPRTMSDRMIYDVLDGMVKGALPSNFQELKLMLTGYTGNIEGKNAPFRFTADVGKMAKMDERFLTRDGKWYVVDPNNDKHMEMFFQSTVKFAGSLKMARDIKIAGRSQYYTQVMRENVLREVGFPDMMVPVDPDNPDGPKRYRYARNIGTAENPEWVQDFGKFLAAFTWSYRKHSTLINEANTVFLSSMAISDDDTRGIVSPLKSSEGGVTLGDLAEPMSSIYGTYSVGRVFSGLFANVSTGDDPHWIGRTMKRTDNAIEREYDQRYTKKFWVTNKYANYSLRRFKNENRLLRGSEATDEEKEQDKQVKDSIRFISSIRAQKVFKITDYYMEHNWEDYDIQFDMLLAIADKRTSAASTYNRKIFGDIADNPFSYMNTEDRSTIKMLSVLLTSVAKSMREGNQVLAGVIDTERFYAGIGQRKLPKGEEGEEIRNHMKSLAKALRDKGWILRSGDAEGSDRAFQYGANGKSSVYVPESGQKVSGTARGTVTFFDKMSSENQKAAYDSIVRLHPSHGKNMDPKTQKLMARSYFQIMGADGLVNSSFVACYADSEDRGTYQAIRLAREQGIPVFNAADYTDLDQWERDVVDAATKAGKGQLRSEKVSLNQANELETAIRAIIMSNPDIFMHYNMDSPAGFLESPFGKKMLQYADDPGKLGGIYTAMVFDYRMERINALTSEFLNQKNTAKIQRVWDDLLLAKDELSSASETWHALIREFEAESTPGMKSFFQMMHDNKPIQHTKVVNKQGVEVDFQYPWGPKPIKDGDWAMVREKGYPNLRAIIEDLDLDLKSKRDIIADVVRYWEKDAYLKSYEVPYQLEVGNDSTYVLGGGAQSGLTTVHKDFEQAFNGWAKKSHILLREDVDRAKSKFSKYPGRLMETIKRLDEEPFELIAIDDEMYADSILSVYDKTYAQTEKASQNPWTNAIYAALSYQQLGGYMNDIQRTDDRLLGLTAATSVGVQDIIHLFANPEEYLTVYDKYGRIGMISRDILLSTEFPLSNDVEADMWRFLSMQPRVAAAIRKHSACVKNDSDGEGYLGAKASISETIESLGVTHDRLSHVKYLMRDHPAYAAIISLALPGKNLISRTARRHIKEIEDFLAYDLYMAASSDYDSATAAQMILNDLTITNEGLRAAMRSDYDTFLEKLGLEAYKYTDEKGRLESEVDADITYNYALERMTAYVEEVRASNVVLGEFIEMPKIPGKPEGTMGDGLAEYETYDTGVDAVSAAAFWDVVQELSGAKTAVSTGIEGSETYRYANWVSHIRARDSYADLETVNFNDEFSKEYSLDDRRGGYGAQWAGAEIINIKNEDGSPVFLEVDEEGVSFFVRKANEDGVLIPYQYYVNAKEKDQLSLADAKSEFNVNEIVVRVPEGYIVKDRSTDSNGTQVASLMAYMVSKRSNGAEAFNLKAKKAGIDGKDSITKKLPGGKHRMGTDYYQILLMLQNLARRRGIDAAKLRLAEMMLAENNLIGYDDMTLANYMSIADIMLIEGQDGEVYLRSLEMLLSAIKYRIGFKVDDMTDDQLFEAVDQIVNDNSENGVGINRMLDNPIAALDNLRPASISTQHSAMRQNSSVFTRNYDLLMEIASTAHSMGIEPMDPENAGRFDEKFRKMMSADDADYKLSDVTKNYNFIGWVGAPDGRMNLNWSVGPSNAIFIGGYPIFDAAKNDYVQLTSDDVLDICQEASELGMTVIFDGAAMNLIPKYYLQSAVEMQTGKNDPSQYLIPNFDMRLNGSEATPFKPHFAIGQVDYSELVVSVEDPVNEFGLGDAEAIAMKGFVDRVKVFDGRSEQIKAEDLFPNVMKNPAFGGTRYDYVVGLATGREIKNLIVDGVRCTIDYGIPEGAKGFDQRKKDVDAAIERYRARWQNANSDGIMMGEKAGELEPGDIVAFAAIGIIDKMNPMNKQYALAPIIPFPLHGVKRQPSLYSIGNIGKVDDDSTLFHVDWSNVSDITKHFVKYFDSSGGANKQMMDMTQAIDEDRTLLDGTPVDVYIAKASTDSRKVGTDRRIKTMITLMMKARMNGYNFARRPDGSMNPDAFPDNPEIRDPQSGEMVPIREFLYHKRIPFGEWKQLLGSGIRFVTDDTLNAFITYECKKILDDEGNPSDYLANIYTDENGVESDTHVMWEFECMFEQGLNYEDGLLRFMSFVNPIAPGSKVKNFCPNGITDNSNDCLFRLQQDANGDIEQGYDRGVLQMRIPHKNQIANGVMSYTWGNVSIGKSFFGEEYSGFSRPNVAGASLFLDGMNTMSMYGKRLKPSLQRQRNYWATADIGRVRGNSSMEVTEEE